MVIHLTKQMNYIYSNGDPIKIQNRIARYSKKLLQR
jgi:hypothetical protein